MCTVAVTIPDAVLYDNNMTVADAEQFVRRMAALGLYEDNNVSLGYCAEVAGMTEADFTLFLGEHNVSIFQFDSDDELDRDFANAQLGLKASDASRAGEGL